MQIRVRLVLLLALGLVVLAACGVPDPPPAVEREVAVTLAGDGAGNVTSSPPGIDVVGGTPAATFVSGTVVTLTATPAEGSTFEGFTFADPERECEEGNDDNTCVITVDESVAVTATFELDDPVTVDPVDLTVVTVGDGSVTSDPAGIDTGAAQDSAEFERNTVVTLTATPEAGAEFVSWDPELDCAEGGAVNPCVVTLTEDTTTITATFTEVVVEDPVELSVSVVGNGNVTSNPAGIDTAEAQTTAEFERDAVVTLTATADAGNTFVSWDPGLACADGATVNPCVVTLADDVAVSATFEELPVGTENLTVDVVAAGDAAGNVVSAPEGIDTAAGDFTAPFDIGTSVTLTAEATEGHFAGWTGGVCAVATEPTCTFTIVEGQPQVTANFNDAVTLTFELAEQSDNAEEFLADSTNTGNVNDRWPTGHTYTFSNDLELGFDPSHAPQAVGVRFPNVTLPAGANVLDATIGFTAFSQSPGGTGTGSPALTITGQADPEEVDASAFVADPNPATGPNPGGFNVTERVRTDSSVPWTIEATWEADETYQSSNVAPILREILALEGWDAGNAVVFIIEPLDITSTDFRRAHAFEGTGPNPVLTVTYVPLPLP